MNTFAVLLPLVTFLAEVGPEPEDVKAGWLGFGVFLALAAAVAVLGFSLRKHLRRVDFEEEPPAQTPTDQTKPAAD